MAELENFPAPYFSRAWRDCYNKNYRRKERRKCTVSRQSNQPSS